MSITPWQLGATGPVWNITFLKPPLAFGNPPRAFDLTGLAGTAITTTICDNQRAESDALYARAGTGEWVITDPANGKAAYAPSDADVGTEGDFSVRFSIRGTDGLLYKWPPQRFVVTNRGS